MLWEHSQPEAGAKPHSQLHRCALSGSEGALEPAKAFKSLRLGVGVGGRLGSYLLVDSVNLQELRTAENCWKGGNPTFPMEESHLFISKDAQSRRIQTHSRKSIFHIP